MLAMANRDGIVEATIPGLADRARISIEQCESALERFQQPDKYSWSQEEEGRRVKKVDGGWFLVNHFKYKALLSEETQRERTRLRVEKLRSVRKSVTPVTGNGSNGQSNALYDIQDQSQTQVSQNLRANARFPKKRIDLTKHANPSCTNCGSSGYRRSYSDPKKEVPCECAAPDAEWRSQ